MGGPIKEGVMHGIREPYRSGQLVRPGPGRPGYRGPGEINPEAWIPKTNKIPKSKLGIVSTVGKKVPFLKKPIETISRSTKDLIPRTWSKIKDIYRGAPKDKNYVPPGALTNRWYWERGIKPTGTLIAGAGKKVLPYATTGSLGYLGYQGAKGLFGGDKTIDENIDISTVIPGGPGGPPGGGDPNMRYKDPDAAKKLAAKRRDERINNLLETMGYDAAKKDAVSKALIDASQIVSDRGTLDKKNITRELINPIIAATSKRLEKPEQLNEAVRLMLTKAEIEKEMNPLKDQELRLRIEAAKKTLAGGTLQEAVLEQTLKQGAPTGSTLSQIARAKGIDNKVLPIKIPKNQDTLEVATEVITDTWKNAATEPDKVVKPGVYVVKDRIIIVEEDGSIKPYL
jgi:hypothetical protein